MSRRTIATHTGKPRQIEVCAFSFDDLGQIGKANFYRFS